MNQDLSSQYPSPYEIEEALSMCRRSFLDKFAQARGIFVFRGTKGDLARHLTSYFYEDLDLEEIRSHAYRVNSKRIESAFIISSNEEEFDPVTILESKRISLNGKEGLTLSAIKQNPETQQNEGEMEYTLNKPGRINLLQHEPRNVKYSVTEIDPGTYKVAVRAESSTDANRFSNFFKSVLDKEVRLETIQFNLLESQETIQFFDDLSTSGMGGDWRLSQVNRLIFRRGIQQSDEEGESQEVKSEVLSGINRAILDGKNLRENNFVKQAETEGYRFSAMLIEYEHIEKGLIIEIRAEFKLRPEIFEIAIESYKKVVLSDSGDETQEDEDLSQSEENRICNEIWQQAKRIYDNLRADIPIDDANHPNLENEEEVEA